MKGWERQITIAARPEEVFALVGDLTRHGEWSGHGLQVTKTGGPVGVGAVYSTTAKQFGTQREESRVTASRPPLEFAWESTGALGRVHHRFAIEPSGEGSRVTKGIEFVAPKFLARLAGWKISKDAPKALEADLARIRDLAERG